MGKSHPVRYLIFICEKIGKINPQSSHFHTLLSQCFSPRNFPPPSLSLQLLLLSNVPPQILSLQILLLPNLSPQIPSPQSLLPQNVPP